MNEISVFAKSLCMLVFICAILEELYPKGSMEKISRFLLSVFILVSLISPIKKLIESDFSFLSIKETISSFSFSSLDDEIVKEASKSIENLAAKELIKENIDFKNITVKMDITESGGISIDKIIVNLKDYENALLAKYTLEEALNIKTEVVINA